MHYILFIVFAFLSGCTSLALTFHPNEVATVAEAGETYVAVLAVEPWDKIRNELSPGFKLDAAGALAAAIPRVSSLEERLLSGFAARLGISAEKLPSPPADAGAEGSGASEAPQPPSLPGADVIPELGERTVANLPGLPDDVEKGVLSENDPFLRYQVANAIFQYVTVLDRLVKTTPEFEDYTPFLVTLQISSIPYARHQPYDVYVDASFFPATVNTGELWEKSPDERDPFFRNPKVVPVMITDNVLAQSTSRAAEIVRQFQLAAQAATASVSGALGLNSLNARSAAVFGTDLTSTFTVGRSGENSLTAVLGAVRNPVSDFSMVRRTHNVSVLLFVPNDVVKASTQSLPSEEKEAAFERRIDVTFTTQLRRPDQVGDPLPQGAGAIPRIKATRERLDRYGLPAPDAGPESKCRELILGAGRVLGDDEPHFSDNDKLLVALSSTIPTGNGERFDRFLRSCDANYGFPEALHHVLSDVYGASPGFRTTSIVLPKAPTRPQQPSQSTLVFAGISQTVAAFDVAERELMSVVIPGASGTLGPAVQAELILPTKAGTSIPFVSQRVEHSGGKLTISFSSPLALGVEPRPSGGRLVVMEPVTTNDQTRWRELLRRNVSYSGVKKPEGPRTTAPSGATAVISVDEKGALSAEVAAPGRSATKPASKPAVQAAPANPG